jgi:mannose-6-phosphate isomerase-like protein (cupin superfamily)
MFDTWLDGGVAIGWHRHDDTDELYYVLSGTLTVACGPDIGSADVVELRGGDVHRLRAGNGHAALAGPDGARIVVVEVTGSPT